MITTPDSLQPEQPADLTGRTWNNFEVCPYLLFFMTGIQQ